MVRNRGLLHVWSNSVRKKKLAAERNPKEPGQQNLQKYHAGGRRDEKRGEGAISHRMADRLLKKRRRFSFIRTVKNVGKEGKCNDQPLFRLSSSRRRNLTEGSRLASPPMHSPQF